MVQNNESKMLNTRNKIQYKKQPHLPFQSLNVRLNPHDKITSKYRYTHKAKKDMELNKYLHHTFYVFFETKNRTNTHIPHSDWPVVPVTMGQIKSIVFMQPKITNLSQRVLQFVQLFPIDGSVLC